MLGTRGLWTDGWKVVAERGPMIGKGNFENDTWQLFHTDVDRSEAHDLAAQYPDKVRELVDLWYAEAGKYNVLPLDDRTAAELSQSMPVAPIPPAGIFTYYPGSPLASRENPIGQEWRVISPRANCYVRGASTVRDSCG